MGAQNKPFCSLAADCSVFEGRDAPDSAFAEAQGCNVQQMMSYFSCEEIASDVRVIFLCKLVYLERPQVVGDF